MKKLIIDGNNLIHRTFWVSKTQARKSNIDCNDKINSLHIYFTLNAIFSYVTQFSPTITFMVWDEKPDYRENLRKGKFNEYKGTRSKDNSPHQNNSTIQVILESIGIRSVFPRELEADDVVAYLCNHYQADAYCSIISVDKDFLQLITDKISLYDPIRKTLYTNQTLEVMTGYSNTADWFTAKCLLGDASDNVPGVPKFTKRKVISFLKGDIKLTSEEEEVYNRNNNIFSLKLIDNMHEELEYYSNQLAREIKVDWKAFIKMCKENKLNNILSKREKWYNQFILKGKLERLFV